MAYALAAAVAAITATLGNALISTNISSIAGSLGEYVAAITLLPAVFVATNATGNLTMVKARIRWGIPAVTQTVLVMYAFAAFLEFLHPTFALAIAVRATSGLAAAALITLSVYYLLQVFPPALRPAALVTGLGLVQLGTPLARLFPVEELARQHWHGLHQIELALPLIMLTVMNAVPLPPSDRSEAFEPLDFLTIALVISGMMLLCLVLGAGRVYWWTDTPWVGWLLALAVPLLAAAAVIETQRKSPLLYLNWVGTGVILRFAAVAVLMRLALAEQTYGSVGLLSAGGLNNSQLRTVFALVIVAMLLGVATAVLTLHPARLREQVIVAALAIAGGAWLDSNATNLTGPRELYLSQALIGFGTTLFIGPALAFGFLQMIKRGPVYFVTLVVLFSTTQNVGGLAGSALLGSLQFQATRAHVSALSDHLSLADPQVVARIESGALLVADSGADPARRATQGVALLAQAEAREATVLAFNDVFRFVAGLALTTAVFVAGLVVRDHWRARRVLEPGVAA